jgi:predicted adenylyl cyclase CyaB
VLETEIKFRAADLGRIRRELLEMGAVLVRERHREDNRLYDFPSGTLRANHRALRLRIAGKKTYLTFKGTPEKSRRFKIRPEFETEVRDASAVRKILKALGLSPVFRYAKQRTELRLGRVTVCLDELAIGTFVELEGERPHIARLAGRLNVPSRDWVKKDYIQLLIAAGFAKGTTHSSSRSAAPGSSGSSSSSPSSSPSGSAVSSS